MMSKTHLTVGVATSLAICQPATVGTLMTAIAGGAAGSILCDIECKGHPGMWDAAIGRIIAIGISLTALAIDYFAGDSLVLPTIQQIQMRNYSSLISGAIVLLATCIAGRHSQHRTFTHSLLYVLLISLGFGCISSALSLPVFAAGISHLVIDTFNKKPVPWLFPFFRPGICFKICYASKIGNTVLMWSGLAASLALLTYRLFIIV